MKFLACAFSRIALLGIVVAALLLAPGIFVKGDFLGYTAAYAKGGGDKGGGNSGGQGGGNSGGKGGGNSGGQGVGNGGGKGKGSDKAGGNSGGKGNGSDKAGGNSGGKGGNSQGGSQGKGTDGANSGGRGKGNSDASGGGQGKGNGNGNGNRGTGGNSGRPGSGKPGERHGAVASSLGRLNAAHASPTARAHASTNSTVGRIAVYERAVQTTNHTRALLERLQLDPDTTPEELAAAIARVERAERREALALQAAANKPVTDQVAREVQDLLGLASRNR